MKNNDVHVADSRVAIIPTDQMEKSIDIDDLVCLRDACKCGNKHDEAIVMICGCIDGGINTGPTIISVLDRLGFNPRHIAVLLKNEQGSNPALHRWQKASDGTLGLH